MKGTEAFKRTIGEYLQVRANTDEIFAQRMKKEGKTLDGCVDFILNTVKQSGCNGFEDDEMTISPTTPITDAMHVKREIEMFRRAQEAIKELRLQEKLRKAKVRQAREGGCE